MLPPVSLCLVPAILTSTLFLFKKQLLDGGKTSLRSATQQIAHLGMHARSRTRIHAPSHERALRIRARAQARTSTHTHMCGRAGPASRARRPSTTKCEARQSRCDIDTEPMVGRRRTVRRCRPAWQAFYAQTHCGSFNAKGVLHNTLHEASWHAG